MKFVNRKFNTPKVRLFVYDLINSYDYDSYDDLSYSDKCQFASQMIDALDTDDSECILELNNFEEIMTLLKKSLAGGSEDDKEFLYTLKESFIEHYEENMKLIFDDVLADKWREDNNWLDYMSLSADPEEELEKSRRGRRL